MSEKNSPRDRQGDRMPEVGKRYTVTMQDCCIEGSFTAILTSREPQDDGDETLSFDNGVVLTTWMQVTFTEEHR